ncbi:MAG: lipid A export permease/ATP-binding protein MsbA [Betaproteobacteria bacterium]|nr:lipid A export permease/ATP-binding protein MsbA [Betaproteobacteria bacterium]
MSSTQLYRRLLSYVRPYRWVFAAAILGMALVAASDALLAWFTAPLINNFVNPDPLWVVWAPVVVLGIFLFRGLGSYISDYGMAWVGNRVVADLRGEMTAHLLRLSTPFYDHQSRGTLVSKLTWDAMQVASATSGAITALIRGTLTILGLLVFLLYENWQLTMLLVVVVPLVAMVIRYFTKRLRRTSREVQEAIGRLTHVLEELVGGHRVVKVFRGEDYETRRTEAASEDLRRAMTRQSSATAASNPVTQLLAALVVALVLFVALQQSASGHITVGGFTAYIFAMLRLLDQLKMLTGVNATLQRALAAAESIFKLLDEPMETDRGQLELGRARGELSFLGVRMRYGSGEAARWALAGIDLRIAAGETLALVGPSGGGKTTLVNLIARFYHPTEGRVLLDGHDLEEIKLASLRDNLAMVSQDVVLFNGSVGANIAYGAMGGCAPQAIVEAARAAHALDFIEALPAGFDTLVGENGVRLSGGQRQRIAIARAILKDAPILILDEATSALDSESERQVQAALETLMHGRTTIVIAHRLSTIEHADRIAVLDRGSVAEVGTHAELLAREGVYARLHRLQFSALT